LKFCSRESWSRRRYIITQVIVTSCYIANINFTCLEQFQQVKTLKEGANKQVISSQADSLIKISRIWADFFPANTSNQPI
ncbi:hypothetical protein, partial [Staphylococcus haemolyticus]|uniref:hypothetical protein n=1 Tax=Staphylococcus haemolyticus TaxID=1283 RepID=UPI001F0A3EE1